MRDENMASASLSWLIGLRLASLGAAVLAAGCSPSSNSTTVALYPPGTVTFTKHIAPIIYSRCADCHRPGQAAPFSLLEFADVKKRARQIAEVVQSRFMPPWLPEEPHFVGERRLSEHEIQTIGQWIAEGAIEGNPADLPTPRTWADTWQLGTPDLIVTMPTPFTLAPDGKDTYRNFVIPAPNSQARFIKAVEIRPTNPPVVHHAVMQIDRTESSRKLDERDPEPGFASGMSIGRAQLPDGQFIGWTPGKFPSRPIDGMAWLLEPGTDLVLQLHMRPTGKPEPVQVSIGLYFANQPPTRRSFAFVLRSKTIDIPPGPKDYVVEKSDVLPVDVDLIRIYPHAHYLAKEMNVWATRPDGERIVLLNIRDWDFNWQDEYEYPTPLPLPAGTRISMRYRFDNSAGNPRNPNQPPKRVAYGQNSTDEMAELLLQVSPRDPSHLPILHEQSMHRAILEEIDRGIALIRRNPNDSTEHQKLAMFYRQLGRVPDAVHHFREVLRIEPSSVAAHYWLGNTLAEADNLEQALPHFRQAQRLQPDQPELLSALAQALARTSNPGPGDRAEALQLATRAVELTHRKDPMILETLSVALAANGRSEQAQQLANEAARAALALNQPELAEQIRQRNQAGF